MLLLMTPPNAQARAVGSGPGVIAAVEAPKLYTKMTMGIGLSILLCFIVI